MNKYNNACVYKIYNKLNPEEFYIGSTILSLTRRFQNHKSKTVKKTRISLYDCMLEKGFDNFDIELVCCYETCENQKQLKMLEQEVMDELKPTINKNRAISTEKDKKIWKDNNREKHNEYSKQWRIINKERTRTNFLCECGKYTNIHSKLRHEKSKHHQNFINNQLIKI